MKSNINLFFIILAISFSMIACTNELSDPQAQAIPEANAAFGGETYFSRVSPTSPNAYRIDLLRHSDGSVQLNRSVVPHNSSYNYLDIGVDNTANVVKSGSEALISFPGSSFFIPFDPTEPVAMITGIDITKLTCKCDADGLCEPEITYHDNSTTIRRIRCLPDDCTGNCDAIKQAAPYQSQDEAGIYISATQIL